MACLPSRCPFVEDDGVDLAAFSNASPPRIRIPAFAARPVATITAVGNSESHGTRAGDDGPKPGEPTTKTKPISGKMPSRKCKQRKRNDHRYEEALIWSARCWMGGLEPCASRRIRTRHPGERTVGPNGRDAVAKRTHWFNVPP